MDLSRVGTQDLVALRKRLASGAVRTPLTTASLKTRAFLAKSAPDLLTSTSEAALLAAIDAALAERNTHRPEVELVWTGPDTVGSETRDTAEVLRELFTTAQTEVILAGYAFDHGRKLFDPLKTAMLEREVRATFFIDVPAPKSGPANPDKLSAQAVDTFVQDNWPEATAPYPDFYYDPRTVGSAPYLSLHAKCVIIDRQRALIGSANFTDRGTERNIECGALIHDPAFAARLAGQWMDLVSSDRMHHAPYSPSSS